MIKINLLGETRKIDPTRGFWILGIILGGIGLSVAGAIAFMSLTTEVVELRSETELLQAQLTNVKKVTKSVAELDRKRGELTEKLKIISILKRSKVGPVRLLDDINTAVPERSWLTTMKESEGSLAISGLALDNQTVAAFMRDLAKSDYVEAVDLVEARNAKKDGQEIKSFTLSAKIAYAGKAVAAAIAAAEAADKAKLAAAKAAVDKKKKAAVAKVEGE
jgi:type IV pilus assembly protein PilN